MKIRKARERDLDRLCELGYKLLKHHMKFRKYYTPVSEGKKRTRMQKKYYKEHIKKRSCLFLVLEQDDNAVGYSIAKIEKSPPVLNEKEYGNFAEIYVDRGYRNKGWGRKLLEKSLGWFRRRGVKRSTVKYDAKNPEGERFYRTAGFRPFQNEYEVYLK
ncbi:GNAT family N-acetyltransferase [Candidatus Micrarchaeota archaeon]|nr:GNAT family N-acetyltransferase [Candidatus Micrarchaeota archaeon]